MTTTFTPEIKKHVIREYARLIMAGLGFIPILAVIITIAYFTCSNGVRLLCEIGWATPFTWIVYISGVVYAIFLIRLQKKTIQYIVDVAELTQKGLATRKVNLTILIGGPFSVLLLTLRNIGLLVKVFFEPTIVKTGPSLADKILGDDSIPGSNASGIHEKKDRSKAFRDAMGSHD